MAGMAAQPSPRRRVQFSLRTLMIVTTIVAVFCATGAWALRYRLGLTKTAEHEIKPIDDYVPDADTAIKIAVAAWEPIYGMDQIAGEKPYRAHLANGVWIVEGSLPDGWRGGVAFAEIVKRDGRVLRVNHGK
jgi:hypothetical protein